MQKSFTCIFKFSKILYKLKIFSDIYLYFVSANTEMNLTLCIIKKKCIQDNKY